MSDTCPTVKIKDASAPGGFVVINEEDFDESVHKKFSEKAVATEEGETETQTKAELVEAAEAKGIQLKSSMTKAEIQDALDLEAGKTKAELVDLAQSKGLDTSGTKVDLVNRLIG